MNYVLIACEDSGNQGPYYAEVVDGVIKTLSTNEKDGTALTPTLAEHVLKTGGQLGFSGARNWRVLPVTPTPDGHTVDERSEMEELLTRIDRSYKVMLNVLWDPRADKATLHNAARNFRLLAQRLEEKTRR